MAIASSSGVRYAYVPEVTPGTTPATPVFQVMRVTSGGLRSNKSTVRSDEVRADQNVIDEALVGMDVAGSYPFELSYGAFDPLLESLFQASWVDDVLKNGIVPKAFTFEETIENGANDSFSRFSGSVVSALSLSIAAREKITGSLTIMGRKEDLGTAIVTGATYTPASTEPILTASANVGALSIAGLAPIPRIRRITLDITRNARTRPVVGDLYSDDFGYGQCVVTGLIEAYFETNALYQKSLDHGGGAIGFNLGSVTLKKYALLLPNTVFLDGAKVIGGNGDDVMVSMPFLAKFDATEGCAVKLTRALA